MISLFMPLILCFTVAVSVGLGVVAAYAAFMGILHAIGHSQSETEATRPRLVLVASQNHASGD
jgi:hypothetical protein